MPDSRSTGTGILPYPVVPTVVVVDGDRVAGCGLPDVDPETVVVAGGSVYLRTTCSRVYARLGTLGPAGLPQHSPSQVTLP